MSDVRTDELMAVLCARQIHDWERLAAGANSPIPAAGVRLAQELWAPNAREAGSGDVAPFIGAKEFTQLIQRGKVDLFFFSAVQLDRHGNMNLQYVDLPDGRRRRFQGAFAAPIYYYSAKRIVMFRTEHTPRFFVDQVDYVTASAASHPRLRRHGTLTDIITPLAVLRYNPEAAGIELASVHEGHTVDEVQAATGFSLPLADGFGTTVPPSEQELEALHGPVYDSMAGLYPQFVARMRSEEKVG